MKNKLLILVTSLLLGSNSFSQSNGNELFDNTYVHEIRITFEQENFWDSLEYYYAQYLDFGVEIKEMMASIEIDGNFIDSVAVREKGYYSNWGSDGLKEPFKIDLNEYVAGQKYDGLKKINLQNGFSDPSFMRDVLAYKFMRDAGIAAPRTSYARLYLNDEYWGLYIIAEQVDDRFLKNWYENDEGNLYKCINNTNLAWQGPGKAAYKDEFELQTNEEFDDWTHFINLVDKIREDDEFEDSISTVLQMNNYLRVLAADVLMYNWDSYYDHGRNFYMYYDSLAQAFQWIPWDYNLAFSNTATDIVVTSGGWGSEPKPLVDNVMDSDVYRKMYFNHLCILAENYFNLENLEAFIDETEALIEDAVNEDPNKLSTTADFHNNIDNNVSLMVGGWWTEFPGLKPFFENRYDEVMGQLAGYDHNCTALSVVEDKETNLKIYPNPSVTGVFNVDLVGDIDEIVVYSLYGQVIYSNVITNETTLQIDLSNFADGVYLVEFIGETKSQHKLVKN